MSPDPTSSNPIGADAFGAVTPHYDVLMASVPYRFWADHLERLWQKHGQHPKRVLDLACGTGTVSRLLAERGYRVMGVDLSEGMLDVARRKAQEARLAIPFVQQDAAELHLDGEPFDAVVCLFDSLNYILDPDRLRAAFVHVFAHLADGGSFVFDVNTEYALAQGMFNQSCTRRDEPLHYRWRSQYDPTTRLCTVRMNFSYDLSDGVRQTFAEVHRQRAYGKEELGEWLRAAGFSEVVFYDGYTTDRPKKRTDRLFCYAQKSESPAEPH